MVYQPKKLTRDVIKINKSITITAAEDPYRRQFIKFVNSLKCPICQSDLDGSIATQANLYCRLNPEEYNAQYTQGSNVPDADCIRLRCPFGNYYKIDHKLLDGAFRDQFTTTVWLVVEEGFSLPQSRFVMEHFGEMLFSAASFNEEDFIRKMELYDVFS